METRKVSEEDLVALRLLKQTYDSLLSNVGTLERQKRGIEAQIAESHGQVDAFERQMNIEFNRLSGKYGLPKTARFNLDTGEIEE